MGKKKKKNPKNDERLCIYTSPNFGLWNLRILVHNLCKYVAVELIFTSLHKYIVDTKNDILSLWTTVKNISGGGFSFEKK